MIGLNQVKSSESFEIEIPANICTVSVNTEVDTFGWDGLLHKVPRIAHYVLNFSSKLSVKYLLHKLLEHYGLVYMTQNEYRNLTGEFQNNLYQRVFHE